jgi:polyphosphate kinase
VVSILGRFLEHARIYHFADGGENRYFIGSADWRSRNLRRRIEVVAPVQDPAARARLAALLDQELSDPKAWELQPDGSYQRRSASAENRSSQEELLSAVSSRA